MNSLKNKILLTVLALVLFCIQTHAFLWNKKEEKTDLIINKKAALSQKDLEYINDNDAAVFKIGERIYFHVYSRKGFKSNFIKYQIVKQDDNAHIGGYTRIRNITKRVKNKNYDVEYFVLSEKGKYIIQIFDIQNLNQWLVYRAFLVTDE